MIKYVLDANAMIALLQDEQGSDVVASAINSAEDGEAEISMNIINLLEVYYDAYRLRGKDQADKMLVEIKKRQIKINAYVSDEIFNEAGRLKASYKISLADSFALAQALVSSGELLTSDHHEFDVIEGNELITFCWIR